MFLLENEPGIFQLKISLSIKLVGILLQFSRESNSLWLSKFKWTLFGLNKVCRETRTFNENWIFENSSRTVFRFSNIKWTFQHLKFEKASNMIFTVIKVLTWNQIWKRRKLEKWLLIFSVTYQKYYFINDCVIKHFMQVTVKLTAQQMTTNKKTSHQKLERNVECRKGLVIVKSLLDKYSLAPIKDIEWRWITFIVFM